MTELSPPNAPFFYDDPAFNRMLCRTSMNEGIDAHCAPNGATALAVMRAHPPNAPVLDLNLASASATTRIEPLRALRPDARLLVLTGNPSIATAVKAIKLGADPYLAEPAEAQAILGAFGTNEPLTEELATTAPMAVDRLEWQHIQPVLRTNDGNISATAHAVKLHQRTRKRKLDKRPVPAR